jgi:hypothetical protein
MQLAKTFAAPPATPQNELAFWSESAVRDRLLAFYMGKFGESERAAQASRFHWAIWRAYLADLVLQGRASRQALAKLLAEARLPMDLIEEGDNLVIDEIADLILQKFRRDPHQAKSYAKCLIAAASRMGQAKAGAQ